MRRSSFILVVLVVAFSFTAQGLPQIFVPISDHLVELEQVRQNPANNNIIGKRINIVRCDEQSIGQWTTEGNYQVWRLDIAVEGEFGLLVYFDELILPQGSSLQAYNASRTKHVGPFNANLNRLIATFALPPIAENRITVEARIPTESVNLFKAQISEVGCVVKNEATSRGFGETDPCYVNVHCPEGSLWFDQTRSVVKYIYTEGTFIGICTGALVNNTSEDERNLFLTAHHCAQGATDEELGQVIFYFNYESADCVNPQDDDDLDDEIVIGCVRLAASGPIGSPPPGGSDFHLFEINPIPASYNVYYAGWNRNHVDVISGPGSVIQHPLADIKKISHVSHFEMSGTSASDIYAMLDTFPGGAGGAVEPNSSGSPMFDLQQLVVGTVSYGSTGCAEEESIAGGGTLWAHWDLNDSVPERQLAPWLDPLNTGVMTLVGKNVSTAGVQTLIDEAGFDFEIVPNPVMNQIRVHNASAEAMTGQVTITDLLGRVVKVSPEVSIESGSYYSADVSDLLGGIYFVIIASENVLTTRKVLILR